MLENIDLQQVLVLDIETAPQYPSFNGAMVKQQQNFIQEEEYWQNLEKSFVFRLGSLQKKKNYPFV